MKEYKTAIIIAFVGFIVFGSLLAREYIQYCSESEYFFVADSIVYPAGDNLTEAKEIAQRQSVRTNHLGETEWEHSTETFIGKKARCESIQVW